MKIKIQIKHWISGVLLFEFETENNTLAQTIREANLYGANLYEADLRGANLYGANLYEADLRGANLRGANLYEADLRGADLRGADLYEANLYGANLRGADLYGANLRGADLRGANLRGADLRGANLYGADLYGADLRGADLYGADLYEAKNAELVFAQTLIVGEGDVIGWKKCRDGMLVKLMIPADAKRHNATGRKCRAEFADVLEIIDLNDKRKKPTQAISQHDESVIYEVGKRMVPHHYEPNRFEECAGGIHFFITKIEAENYV